MNELSRSSLRGAAAGAAGTTALNAVTYLDMALRGRPASRSPEETIKKLSDLAHLGVPGSGDRQVDRIAGLGPLTGLLAGIGVGAAMGAVRSAGWRPGPLVSGLIATLGALLGTNGPMTVLGITDPREWSAGDWVADVIPHLAYGMVTAGVLDGLGHP